MPGIPQNPAPNSPRRIFVVFNPVAGVANAQHLRGRIEAFLTREGVSFEIHDTCPDEDVSQTVRQAVQDGFDLFVAAGGDGTVSQVANGLALTSIPMSILPTGTANVIAKDQFIPLRAQEALKLIFSPHDLIRVDGLKARGNYYILDVSAGFSADLFSHVDWRDKRRLGMFSYFWRGLLQLAGIQPSRFTLIVDGKKSRFYGTDVLVPNCGLIGLHPFMLHPDLRIDDGRVSVCVMRALHLLDYMKIAWDMLRRRQQSPHRVRWIEMRSSVEISTRRTLPVQGDGDPLGVTPVLIEFVPAIVSLIVPPVHDRPR